MYLYKKNRMCLFTLLFIYLRETRKLLIYYFNPPFDIYNFRPYFSNIDKQIVINKTLVIDHNKEALNTYLIRIFHEMHDYGVSYKTSFRIISEFNWFLENVSTLPFYEIYASDTHLRIYFKIFIYLWSFGALDNPKVLHNFFNYYNNDIFRLNTNPADVFAILKELDESKTVRWGFNDFVHMEFSDKEIYYDMYQKFDKEINPNKNINYSFFIKGFTLFFFLSNLDLILFTNLTDLF